MTVKVGMILAGKPDRTTYSKTRRIKLKPIFKETDGRGVDCSDPSQDRNKWRTLVGMVIQLVR